MTDKEFLENVYEIAFGDNAINKDYSHEEVLQRLMSFSDAAFCGHITQDEECDCPIGQCFSIDQQ